MEIINQLGQSFAAFNRNAMTSLIYIMTQNFWIVLIAAAAIVTMIMMMKDELDYTVNEVHNII